MVLPPGPRRRLDQSPATLSPEARGGTQLRPPARAGDSGGHRFHAFADRSALARRLAEDVARVLGEAIARRGVGFLAVSGGTTPAVFFAELALRPLDWSKAIVTLVDERVVPEGSERSNARLVKQKLLVGPAAPARFEPLYREAAGGDAAAAASRAAETLAGLPWPLDAAVLGMGLDGHTASFFPDAKELEPALDPAAPDLVLPVAAASAGEPRVTLTMRPLREAAFLALHIEGAEKRAVLDRALAEGASRRLPIRAVFEARPVEVYWAE